MEKNQFLRISLLFYLVALLCYAWNYPAALNIIVYFYISCMIYICPTDRQKKFLEVTYNMDSKNFQTNQTQAMHYNFFNRENSFFILVSCFAISWQIWIWSTRIQIFSWSWPNFRKTKAPLTLFYIHSLSINISALNCSWHYGLNISFLRSSYPFLRPDMWAMFDYIGMESTILKDSAFSL